MRRIWCRHEKAIEVEAPVAKRRMTLRLVASGNDRALAIRDHVLPLLGGHDAQQTVLDDAGRIDQTADRAKAIQLNPRVFQ